MTFRNLTTRGGLFVGAALLAAVPASAQRGPAPVANNIPAELLSLACKPSVTFEAPPTPLRITGNQDSFTQRVFAPGQLVTINAGTDNGIDVGQEYYVRRTVPLERRAISRSNPATIRTTGWIRVYAVDKQLSLATITHACDSIEMNDYLEPFVLPEIPAVSASKPPAQRDNYGRVLTGNDRRTAFGKGDYFIVDRGSDHGVTVGAHFVVYRDKRQADNFLFELGEAVAVEVRPDSSTLRITLSNDAFTAGDYVALRK